MIFMFQNEEEGKIIMYFISVWHKHNYNKEIIGSNYKVFVPNNNSDKTTKAMQIQNW